MSPEGLLKEAAGKNVRRLALTDINNTSAILDFHRHAKLHGIEPVAGIDFRNGAQQKFIGIAKDQGGFKELNDFLTKCLHQNEYELRGEKIRIPARAPEFQNAFVIYPLSAFQESHRINANNIKDANYILTEFSILNQNEFIGIKPGDLNLLRFSSLRLHPEKLVALAPVTFRNKTDFNAHRLLRAMDNNTLISKLPAEEQASAGEMLRSEEELLDLYKDFPHLLYNSKKLLEQCNVIDFEFDKSKNKKHFLADEKEDRQLLDQLCEEGMSYRYPSSSVKIRERFKKEIDVITSQNFTAYFLINHDIVNFARHHNYCYVGRGSGANSMVAYLLNITDVDPIELDLYFERFINPSRKNPPDFDIDFSSDERDEVISHIFKKHGTAHTALLATYSEMKDNAVTRELGKVFGLPKAEIDALLDHKNLSQTPDHITKLIHQYGRHLYSFPSHLSIHAGGILISEQPITNYTALSNPPKGFPLAQFSMLEAEDVGFSKFDILSQRGLGKIRDSVTLIAKNRKEVIDIHDVNRFKTDHDVKKNLQQAKLMGCFYVESPAMRMLLTKLKASTYLDLVAASSIIRPGVAQSGMMQEYIRRFHDPSRRKYAHPLMKELMEETFGIMVYQEDVIKVAHHFGKLSLEEADRLRRGMGGKYKGREEFQKVKETFFLNCRKEGYDEKLINEVWFQMETFGGYAFAKGHSASYAVESYQCMFLKTYYPLEYMVAVINNGGGFFRAEYYIHEARMCGATIHGPDINKSALETTIIDTHIYLGFNLMADVEKELQQQITIERKHSGEFLSLENFMQRISISVDQLRLLIRGGAFHFTGRTKKQLLWDVHLVLGHEKKSLAKKELFHVENKKHVLPELYSDPFEDACDEIEILGFPLCSPYDLITQPLCSDLVAAAFKKYCGKEVEIIGYYVTYKPTSTKKGEAMMFGCFLDSKGFFFDTNHFPDVTRRFPFRGKGCYLIKGKVTEEFGFYSLNVTEMHKLNYVMYEKDATEIARSNPDPVIKPVTVTRSKQYQYLIVITPPPHIRKEVEMLKKKFHHHFNHYQAVTSKPNIILCSFMMNETGEEAMVRKIASVTYTFSSFKISLNDFNHIGSHTIYTGIEDPDAIIGLVETLKKKLVLPLKESYFSLNPQLTIAKGLDQEKFSIAYALFQQLEYKASFVANNLILLRKENGLLKWETVRQYPLAQLTTPIVA